MFTTTDYSSWESSSICRKYVMFTVDFLIFRDKLSEGNVMGKVLFVLQKENDWIAKLVYLYSGKIKRIFN